MFCTGTVVKEIDSVKAKTVKAAGIYLFLEKRIM